MYLPKRKESSIEASVVQWAKRHGIHYCIKLQGIGNMGLPDRLFLLPGGKALLVEFKRPGEKPTKIQDHTHKELRELGYDVRVFDNRADAIEHLTRELHAASVSEEGDTLCP